MYIRTSESVDDSTYELDQMQQEYTSEKTSINFAKVPAVFKLVTNWRKGTINIDYGGGRADTAADYLTQYDVINLVYDPYNRTPEHNKEVIKTLRRAGGADTATCSNVLNVIKEPEVRKNVLENISKIVKPGGKVYITVYEGSGKGDEGPTKAGYQLNRKTADYLDEIREVFPDANRKGKLIVATNSRTINSSTHVTSEIELPKNISTIIKSTMPSVDNVVFDYDIDEDSINLYAHLSDEFDYEYEDEGLDEDTIYAIEDWANAIANSVDDEELKECILRNIEYDWYSGMTLYSGGDMPFTYSRFVYPIDLEI